MLSSDMVIPEISDAAPVPVVSDSPTVKPFVLNSIGNEDFSQITQEQADAINAGHRAIRNAPAGPVRMTPDRAAHIWKNPSRRRQLQALGYNSPEAFVHDVGHAFTAIYDTGSNSVALVRRIPDDRAIWANLIEGETPEWRVGSGTPFSDKKLKNKTRLWPPPREVAPVCNQNADEWSATQLDGPGAGHPGSFSPSHVTNSQTVEGAGFTAVPPQRSPSNIGPNSQKGNIGGSATPPPTAPRN